MNRGWALGFVLIAVAALALRCARLDNRPMHNDEAVNALKLGGYWSTNAYRYDPNEHHGPSLYYSSLPAVWLSRTPSYNELNEITMRLTPALFGVGLVVLLWPLRRGLGRAATLVAAALTALSPAMVFYSRYYIHEMLLVFSTLLLLIGGWRYARGGGIAWAMLAGAGSGLMYATKETFVFSLFALFVAVMAASMMESGRRGVGRMLEVCRRGPLLAAVLAAMVVSGLLFTSFGTNWEGPLDSLRTYLPWLKRAGGESPHIQPWYFYLERLAWFHKPKGPVFTEGLILSLGLLGMAAGLSGHWLRDTDRRLVRVLTFYTLTLTAIYSAISYKTPWCLLGFWHGWILLAGVGTVALFGICRGRGAKLALLVVLFAGVVHMAWLTWQSSFVRFADWRNPYVYAQTVPDVLRLTQLVDNLTTVHPAGRQMLVKVAAPDSDYWPLPYYLRRLTQVGWFDRLPDDPYAPVVVAASKLGAALDDRSEKRWLMVGLFELRPRVFLELYVEIELWKRWVAVAPRPADEP